jgi:hypothetical protein
VAKNRLIVRAAVRWRSRSGRVRTGCSALRALSAPWPTQPRPGHSGATVAAVPGQWARRRVLRWLYAAAGPAALVRDLLLARPHYRPRTHVRGDERGGLDIRVPADRLHSVAPASGALSARLTAQGAVPAGPSPLPPVEDGDAVEVERCVSRPGLPGRPATACRGDPRRPPGRHPDRARHADVLRPGDPRAAPHPQEPPHPLGRSRACAEPARPGHRPAHPPSRCGSSAGPATPA